MQVTNNNVSYETESPEIVNQSNVITVCASVVANGDLIFASTEDEANYQRIFNKQAKNSSKGNQ